MAAARPLGVEVGCRGSGGRSFRPSVPLAWGDDRNHQRPLGTRQSADPPGFTSQWEMDTTRSPAVSNEPPDLSRLSPDALAFGSKAAERMAADVGWGSDLPDGLASPDDRWQNLMVGTKADLENVVSEFVVHAAMPDGVGRMLLTSRNLFVHSYFMHEFAFVGAVWSVFAIEAALKDVLKVADDDRATLTALTRQARDREWLTTEEAERLRYGAMLRNALVHARSQGTFTGGIAVSVIAASHELTFVLYERSQRIEP